MSSHHIPEDSDKESKSKESVHSRPRKKQKQDRHGIPENVIRVSMKGWIKNCVIRGATLLLKDGFEEIIISGAGFTISRVCEIAVILRNKIEGLHQINTIKHVELEDKYPRRSHEKSDDELRNRFLVVFEIKLCYKPSEEDLESKGYQKPLEDIESATLEEIRSHKPARRR